MDAPLTKQLPDGSWAAIARVVDGQIVPVTVGDCCCDDGCAPPCIQVTLSGLVSIGQCEDNFGNPVIASDPSDLNTSYRLALEDYDPNTGVVRYFAGPYPIDLTIDNSALPNLPDNRIAMFILMEGVCVDGEISVFDLSVLAARTCAGIPNAGSNGVSLIYTDHPHGGDGLEPIGNGPFANQVTPSCDGFVWWGGGEATITVPTECPPFMLAAIRCRPEAECEGVYGDIIIVDPDAVPSNAVSAVVGDDLYIINSQYIPAVDLEPTVPDGWSNENCDNVAATAKIAIQCEGNGEVYYNADDLPASAQTIIYDGDAYIPTATNTTEPPTIGLAFSDDPCPDPQGDRYLATACASGFWSTFGPVAYQVSPGMAPGEGVVFSVYASASPEHPDCLIRVKYRCSADLAAPEVPLASEPQIPGRCGGPISDLSFSDCGNLDDDGGVLPGLRDREITGRGLGDLAARGIKIVTLGRVKPCGACERRRQALNELGRKMGL